MGKKSDEHEMVVWFKSPFCKVGGPSLLGFGYKYLFGRTGLLDVDMPRPRKGDRSVHNPRSTLDYTLKPLRGLRMVPGVKLKMAWVPI